MCNVPRPIFWSFFERMQVQCFGKNQAGKSSRPCCPGSLCCPWLGRANLRCLPDLPNLLEMKRKNWSCCARRTEWTVCRTNRRLFPFYQSPTCRLWPISTTWTIFCCLWSSGRRASWTKRSAATSANPTRPRLAQGCCSRCRRATTGFGCAGYARRWSSCDGRGRTRPSCCGTAAGRRNTATDGSLFESTTWGTRGTRVIGNLAKDRTNAVVHISSGNAMNRGTFVNLALKSFFLR